jgi:hypothetical protein
MNSTTLLRHTIIRGAPEICELPFTGRCAVNQPIEIKPRGAVGV